MSLRIVSKLFARHVDVNRSLYQISLYRNGRTPMHTEVHGPSPITVIFVGITFMHVGALFEQMHACCLF